MHPHAHPNAHVRRSPWAGVYGGGGGGGAQRTTAAPERHSATAPTVSAAAPSPQLGTTPDVVWIRGEFPERELTTVDPAMATAVAPVSEAVADSPTALSAAALAATDSSTLTARVTSETTHTSAESEAEPLGTTVELPAGGGLAPRVRTRLLLEHIKLHEYTAKFEGCGLSVRRCGECRPPNPHGAGTIHTHPSEAIVFLPAPPDSLADSLPPPHPSRLLSPCPTRSCIPRRTPHTCSREASLRPPAVPAHSLRPAPRAARPRNNRDPPLHAAAAAHPPHSCREHPPRGA